jgi:uncharacterized repeat protein (TIGR01451 family)
VSDTAPKFGALSRLFERRIPRAVAALLAILLAFVTLVAGPGLDSAEADSFVSIAASETPSVLAGEPSTVTLTATNVTSQDLYNIAFSYVLPAGVSYSAGTTTPSSVGDPQVFVVTDNSNPANPTTHQVLVWNNVDDLPIGDVEHISFGIVADPSAYPVGAQIPGTGSVYVQTDPRLLTQFDANGAVVPGTYVGSDSASPVQTSVSALRVTKTEPSPESELMRGIHDHTTTYTIKVQNTDVAATDGVTVTDYIPAGLEFLGCGATDNSAAVEYSGAPRLSATPAVPNCVTPDSVDTVNDPTGYPAGVYTKVTWTLGDLAANETTSIVYAAGIPLRANTMTFPGTEPSGASLGQASNLDNNTGAPTRQVNGGQAYTNTAVATGTYTGPVAPGSSTAVTAQGTATVKSMDLSVVKSTTSPDFVSGQIATYDLRVRTSEYTNLAGVKVTDVLPDGICPIVPTGTTIIGTLPSDCTTTGAVSNATVDSVTVNSDGTFTTVFTPTVSTAADADFTIQYTARMRANYHGTNPTAAGDSFVNNAAITGTSTPIAVLGDTSTDTTTDDSHATKVSSAPTIDKQVLPRTTVSGGAADCATHSSEYVENTAPTPVFVLGDIVCFRLSVNFSNSSETRNAQVSDFVPVGTTYDSYVVGTEGSVPASQVTKTSAAVPTWAIGATAGSGSDLFTEKGATLVLYVAAKVTGNLPATRVDITANLMKYRQESTNNTVLALRDSANFGVAPAAQVALTKGVTRINGVAVPGAPSTAVTGKEGDQVDFSLTASNIGTAANGTNVPVDNLVTWDALPAGITCANVSLITPASGTCTDDFLGSLSGLSWRQVGPVAAGSAEPVLTYRVTLPQHLSVSSILSNNASVVSFTSPNTAGGNTTFYPTNSLDTADSSKWNTTAANAASTIALPDAVVTKTGASAPDTNKSSDQVVAGDTLSYSYNVTIPAHTTVFNGVLSDAPPAGLSAPASVTADLAGLGTGFTPATIPAPFTLSATGTLGFGTTYDNTTDAAQVFTVHLSGVVVTPTATTVPFSFTNIATFASNVTPGGTALPSRQASKTLTVTAPTPTLTKDAAGSANAGDIVTYTLHAGNGSASPNGYDTVVIDCLPAGLTFQAYGTLPPGVTTDPATAGNASNGCAVGTVLLTWHVGTLAPGATLALPYTAQVDPSAAGLASYTNTAQLTTSTLNNGKNDSSVEGVLTAAASATTTVSGAVTTKTSSKPDATIGDSTTYTITVDLPAKVNFYQSAIIDQLPAGIAVSNVTLGCVTLPAPGTDCTSQLPGNAAPLTPADGKVGWLLGDVAASNSERSVTLAYVGTVQDVPTSVAGVVLTNSAALSWDKTDKPTDPTSADATFDATGSPGSAKLTVDEPRLTIAKAVSTATPAPGEVFGYTLSVTNGNTASTSTAYDVQVSDVVPTGVVVDPSTISNGGTISGATANGGGTIAWTLPGSIAKNATTQLTYSASLAASSTLTTAGLTNTATVPSYASLPSGGRVYDTAPFPTATQTVTPAFPSVTLRKTAVTTGPAYAGSPFTWSLVATNAAGAGTATDITVTDVLPLGWTYVAGSANVTVAGTSAGQVDPVISTNSGVRTLTWEPFGPVPATKTVAITYSALPPTATTSNTGSAHPQTNTMSAATMDATGATGNKTGSYTGSPSSANAFLGTADVRIAKAAGNPLVAGTTDSKAWTLTVSNAGADTAVGPFTVTDTPAALPAGVSIVSASGSGWSCQPPTAQNVITCTRTSATDTLASAASFPEIDVAVTIAPDVAASTTIDNTATVAGRTFDPDTSNNTSSKQVAVTSSADLGIVKKLAGTALAGQTATWNIDVTNSGPSVSAGPIVVTDTLPTSGLSDVTASGTGWTCVVGSTTVTCTRAADLAVGGAPRITVSGLIDSGFTGSISNTAKITSTVTPDPNSSNDSSTATNPVDDSTTLAFAKTLKSDIVAGANATYELVVTNTGLADARTVKIVDPLPDGLVFAGNVDSVTGNWSCSETSTAPSTVTCLLAGPLSAKSGSKTAEVHFDVTTPPSLVGSVTNTATVSSANAPSVDASATTAPTGVSDLTLAKTHPSGAVIAGTNVTYTLVAQNAGPSDDEGPITVVDTLPAGESFVSAAGTGWVCPTPSGQVVTCTSATGILSSGTAPSITLVAAIGADVQPSTLVNSAVVSGPTDRSDPNPANNIAHDDTVITTSADVTIAKTGPATLVAGDPVTYRLAVNNAGQSDAANLTVIDTLPAGETATAISGTGWSCGLPSLTCTRASLGVTTSTISVSVTVGASVANGTSLTNTAKVSSVDSAGTHTASDTTTGTVHAVANLVLTKTADHPTASAGEADSFTFSLKNTGSSDAVGPIVIADTLPTGMTFQGSTGDWTCVAETANAQIVDCTLNNNAGVAAGGTASVLNISVLLDSSLPAGPIDNSAVVSTPTDETTLADNTATATVTIGDVADLSIVKTLTSPVRIGDESTFSLLVHNGGPSDAAAVTVQDVMPSTLTAIDLSQVDPGWTCTLGTVTSTGTPVNCTLAGTLAASHDAPAIVLGATVTASAYPSIVNTATVSSSTADGNATNNTSSITVTVPPQVILSVVKWHVGDLQVGQDGTYIITVTNTGPTAQPAGYKITDRLPAGLTWVSGGGSGVTCAHSGQVVTCTFTAPLPTGSSASVTLHVLVNPAAFPTVTNSATVSTTAEQLSSAGITGTDPDATVLAAPSAGSPLAFTGVGSLGFDLLLAIGVLLVGLVLVLLRRGRRSLHRTGLPSDGSPDRL